MAQAVWMGVVVGGGGATAPPALAEPREPPAASLYAPHSLLHVGASQDGVFFIRTSFLAGNLMSTLPAMRA